MSSRLARRLFMPPRYTIIIPVAQFAEAEPALAHLRESAPAFGRQILVAIGRQPARQRNAALALATGEIVVFLDNDCAPGPGYWEELERAFARAEVEVVGGPALLRAQAGGTERMVHALLTHPLVVGPVRARYAPHGSFRRSSQAELILCNLAVRRAVFDRIGPFSAKLYPSEENEWLDRGGAAGAGIYYDPALQVLRPQRATWSAAARMLVDYGAGRTKQLQVSGGRFTVHQLALLVLLVPVAALAVLAGGGGGRGLAFFGVAWLAAALLVAVSFGRGSGLSPGRRLVAGLTAPCVPLLYAWGQLVGWFRPWPAAETDISVVDEQGRALDQRFAR